MKGSTPKRRRATKRAPISRRRWGTRRRTAVRKCGTGSQPVRGRKAATLRAADGLRTRPTSRSLYVPEVNRFSRRTNWNPAPNRLSLARAKHLDALDLTVSNPTRVGLPYPLDELSRVMARAARAADDPEPLGLPVAREAAARQR